jgi:hypothetical protein
MAMHTFPCLINRPFQPFPKPSRWTPGHLQFEVMDRENRDDLIGRDADPTDAMNEAVLRLSFPLQLSVCQYSARNTLAVTDFLKNQRLIINAKEGKKKSG